MGVNSKNQIPNSKKCGDFGEGLEFDPEYSGLKI
jgi:hypothetical protein